jgi:hypothetical protein
LTLSRPTSYIAFSIALLGPLPLPSATHLLHMFGLAACRGPPWSAERKGATLCHVVPSSQRRPPARAPAPSTSAARKAPAPTATPVAGSPAPELPPFTACDARRDTCAARVAPEPRAAGRRSPLAAPKFSFCSVSARRAAAFPVVASGGAAAATVAYTINRSRPVRVARETASLSSASDESTTCGSKEGGRKQGRQAR